MFRYNGIKIDNKSWTDDDGTKYPRGWVDGATSVQLYEIGVEVVDDLVKPAFDQATQFIKELPSGDYEVVNYSAEELALRNPPKVVSPWQLRKALNQQGIRQQVEDAISASTDYDLKDGWQYATEFREDDSLVVSMTAALNMTEQDRNDLFSLASTM